MLLDITIATGVGGGILRWSRPFRPVLLLLEHKFLRRMWIVGARSAAGIIPVVAMLGMIFLVFAVVGRHLFFYNQDVYSEPNMEAGTGLFEEHCAEGKCEGITDFWVYNAFSTWPYAFLTLFMLVSSS